VVTEQIHLGCYRPIAMILLQKLNTVAHSLRSYVLAYSRFGACYQRYSFISGCTWSTSRHLQVAQP